MIFNHFDNREINELIVQKIKCFTTLRKYRYDDILILMPSLKSKPKTSIVQNIENALIQQKIPIHIPIDDMQNIDE